MMTEGPIFYSSLSGLLSNGTTLHPRQMHIDKLMSIADAIQQRGFKYLSEDQLDDTLLQYIDDVSKKKAFLESLIEKSYREKVLTAISNNEDFSADGIQIPEHPNNRNLYSKTFELLLAYVGIKEFHYLSSGFGFKVEDAPDGGDFDCLWHSHQGILHLEAKSGHPVNATSEVSSFLRRHDFLAPLVSLLFFDRKKIGKEQIKKFGEESGSLIKKIFEIKMGSSVFYQMRTNVFIVDVHQQGSLVKNIAATLQYFHRKTERGLRRNELIEKADHINSINGVKSAEEIFSGS